MGRTVMLFFIVIVTTGTVTFTLLTLTGNTWFAVGLGISIGLLSTVMYMLGELKTDITKLQTQIADLKRELEEGKQKQHE